MVALKYTFYVFTFLGCLPPASWTSTFKRGLYKVYSLLMMIPMLTMMLSSVLDMLLNVKTQGEFCDNCYITSAMMISSYKMINFLGKRDKIMFLLHSMEKEPFKPESETERNIKMKFDRKTESTSLVYFLALNLYLVGLGSSAMRNLKHGTLLNPRVWLPYNYSLPSFYAMTYSHQASSLVALTYMHYANDTLISGLMIIVDCQLTLLQHRLHNSVAERKSQSVKECVKYHENIYQLAADVNKNFHGIIGFQFMATTPMACLTLFRITTVEVGMQMYECVMYIICTMMQLSYYCWYGNQVKLKSLEIPDAIFASNWPDLDTSSKKMLMIIMERATTPIEFSSGHVVALNLNTFVTVLKTCYSMFNVLQST